ncbi:hypothetical protein [Actinophytocola sp. NPDC049390]|uniref:hypothetical protein n=1 Tax=Actinophytocola sp. NPDC049390 TaxID=3363894 RepID=UPI00378AA628
MDRLANLIDPVPLLDLTTAVCRWLQDAHEAAAELQRARRGGPRGDWQNNTSFGVDRYQYLLATAGSLTAEIPDLQVDPAFQSILLKLPRVGIYQFQVPAGPHGSLGDTSELRRELLTGIDDHGLISRPEIWLGGRDRLFLVWNGSEEHGLTGAWIGQGEMLEKRMDWEWLFSVQDVTGAVGIPRQTGPLDPAIFELSEPMLPLRPRDPEEGSQSG